MAETIQQNVDVGARAKALRKARRLTQPQVAEQVGVTLRAYQAWEAGQNAISWRHLEDLASVLRSSPEFLLHGEDQPIDHVNAGTQLQRIEDRLAEMSDKIDALERLIRQQAVVSETAAAVQRSRKRGRASAPGSRAPRTEGNQH